mmetsp:Transcript_10391/g.22326  ORF Transcript_10391/g.22326 Transcript_10391/m.22326 type:complete len:213 (-) Transcript_10391:339-977(-)|eukprot:CAMPEP_0202893160 /NCGR_PEP_ID=MMETSP1392-20130828/2793_1 /ASSEMBLY_ACC=CAM_ASM_000868 /TAXON_ID=225041 /ORGANISM="Chlamydomonas chlamydogama, Strain SAG 11-48b" /LENGTH=212 /DNA_ID=CAMNT_0049577385 /DNA_START=58 /DNA_END=696 /DNA_ORIENTATION=-
MVNDEEMPTEKRYKIYTKTGDSGTASLYNGQRLPKDAVYFQALGDVDELNSALGLASEWCTAQPHVQEQLAVIQSRLLDVGSAVATPATSTHQTKLQQTRFDEGATPLLETWLDELDSHLPPLFNFILPSGGKASAHLHMARSICRRAERSVVPLTREGHVDQQVAIFLNRLSDYLFTAARFMAHKEGRPEVIYKKAVAPPAVAAAARGDSG